MAEPILVKPDTSFIKNVVASGGGDLKKCFQCATCSTVCTLSPDDAPFPRRQMLLAQWGMKEKLLADPAIWLCHNCGDCTEMCPRGARPGDVFGALRSEAIKYFAFPGFMGKAVAGPKALLLLLLLPAVVFGLIAANAAGVESAGAAEFADMFPQGVLEPLFFTVSGLALLAFLVGMTRYVKAIQFWSGSAGFMAGLGAAVAAILVHKRFAQCGKEKNRYLGHLLTLWGFVGLLVVGTVVGVGSLAGVMETPLALGNPLKILANVAALAILIGSLILLVDRVKDPAKKKASTYFDWFFLLTLVGTVVTGIASELLRLGQAGTVMYAVYYVHLVLIFALLLYAPYSKLAHLAYRTIAMAVDAGRTSVARAGALDAIGTDQLARSSNQ